MAIRCPCLTDEYIGSDSGAICRKGIAKRTGFKCPRQHKPWTPHASCWELERLFKKTREEVEAMLRPATHEIFGTGQPDVPVPAGG